MTLGKRIIALVLMVGVLATSGIVFASEKGRKNTRNALGAATAIMAIKGNGTGTLVGAAGTAIAQHRLNKSIKARHRRDAWKRSHRSTRTWTRHTRLTKAQQRARAHRLWVLKHKKSVAKKY